MKLRVWHIPNVPGNAFHHEVSSIEEAKLILTALARYDLYLGDRVIASNVQGLERLWEKGDLVPDTLPAGTPVMRYPTEEELVMWEEWSDENGREISDYYRHEDFEPIVPRRWK